MSPLNIRIARSSTGERRISKPTVIHQDQKKGAAPPGLSDIDKENMVPDVHIGTRDVVELNGEIETRSNVKRRGTRQASYKTKAKRVPLREMDEEEVHARDSEVLEERRRRISGGNDYIEVLTVPAGAGQYNLPTEAVIPRANPSVANTAPRHGASPFQVLRQLDADTAVTRVARNLKDQIVREQTLLATETVTVSKKRVLGTKQNSRQLATKITSPHIFIDNDENEDFEQSPRKRRSISPVINGNDENAPVTVSHKLTIAASTTGLMQSKSTNILSAKNKNPTVGKALQKKAKKPVLNTLKRATNTTLPSSLARSARATAGSGLEGIRRMR